MEKSGIDIERLISKAEYTLVLTKDLIKQQINGNKCGGDYFSLGRYNIDDFEPDKHYKLWMEDYEVSNYWTNSVVLYMEETNEVVCDIPQYID